MEGLPSDLHRYLTFFMDDSTKVGFPLTCSAVYASLGPAKCSLKKVVAFAARDDNLELMLHYMKRMRGRKAKMFYHDYVALPALKGNAKDTLFWCCDKDYLITIKDLEAVIKTITIPLLDYVLTRNSSDHCPHCYCSHVLELVIKADRSDIFQEKYLRSSCTFIDEQIMDMVENDSIYCFRDFLEHMANPFLPRFVEIVLRKGGYRIVRYMAKLWADHYRSFHMVLMNAIICNRKFNDLAFFRRFMKYYAFTEQQMEFVIKKKNYEVIKLVMENWTVTEAYCRIALFDRAKDAETSKIIMYLFSRFEGKMFIEKIDFPNRALYCRPEIDFEVIAAKLSSVICLSSYIIATKNRELFRRLLTELDASENPLRENLKRSKSELDEENRGFLFWDFYNVDMLEIYLENHTIAEADQLLIYEHKRETFVELLERKHHPVSPKIARRRIVLQNREARKRQREEDVSEVSVKRQKK